MNYSFETPVSDCPPRAPVKSTSARSRRRILFPIERQESVDSNLHEISFVERDSSSQPINQTPGYDQYSNESYLRQCFDNLGPLGSGSFAKVYKVRSREDGNLYAVKKAHHPFRSQADRAEKLQEVSKHELLPPHPNCTAFIRAWEEQRYLHIQTELCLTSLRALAEHNHDLPEQMLWDYTHDLLAAIDHLHQQRLIHLDVKPANAFVGTDNLCKLGDFGLVISFDKAADRRYDVIEGDPKYLAPEVLDGVVTPLADIFSVGMTILELASDCELPGSGPEWHALREPTLLEHIRRTLADKGRSDSLRQVIEWMRNGDPSSRPPSAQYLLNSVDQLISRRGRSVPTISTTSAAITINSNFSRDSLSLTGVKEKIFGFYSQAVKLFLLAVGLLVKWIIVASRRTTTLVLWCLTLLFCLLCWLFNLIIVSPLNTLGFHLALTNTGQQPSPPLHSSPHPGQLEQNCQPQAGEFFSTAVAGAVSASAPYSTNADNSISTATCSNLELNASFCSDDEEDADEGFEDSLNLPQNPPAHRLNPLQTSAPPRHLPSTSTAHAGGVLTYPNPAPPSPPPPSCSAAALALTTGVSAAVAPDTPVKELSLVIPRLASDTTVAVNSCPPRLLLAPSNPSSFSTGSHLQRDTIRRRCFGDGESSEEDPDCGDRLNQICDDYELGPDSSPKLSRLPPARFRQITGHYNLGRHRHQLTSSPAHAEHPEVAQGKALSELRRPRDSSSVAIGNATSTNQSVSCGQRRPFSHVQRRLFKLTDDDNDFSDGGDGS